MCVLSIVIPNYNNGKFLQRCLGSILKSDNYDFEVIVIDDGSTDNSGSFLKSIKDVSKRHKVFYKTFNSQEINYEIDRLRAWRSICF